MAAASSLAVGKKAPDFALKNQDDEVVRLRDLAGGWVVLYFYPKDDTPGCTVEACDFTSGIKGFEKLEAKVLGCSPDSTESHRRFIAKHKLKIDLLSDPAHETLLDYGAWGEKNMYGRVTQGVLRSTVIIDPKGKVAHHWPKVSAQGHAAAVREKLKELQTDAEE
jgi:thioredoxin-dependent peroxiredoxin